MAAWSGGRLVALAWVVGCGWQPRPAADLPTVAGWMQGAGYATTPEPGRLRWSCPGEQGVAALVSEEGPLLRLRTNGLLRLEEARDARHVVLLLTQLATSSHDLPWGGLSLEPEQGEVIYRIDLPRHDGLGEATVREAAAALCEGSARVRPLLQRSASADPL